MDKFDALVAASEIVVACMFPDLDTLLQNIQDIDIIEKYEKIAVQKYDSADDAA